MSKTSLEIPTPPPLFDAEAAITEAGMFALAAWQYGKAVGLAKRNNQMEVSTSSNSRHFADLYIGMNKPCPSNPAEYIGPLTARVNARQGLYEARVWRDKDGQFHTEFGTTVHRPKANFEHGYYCYGPYYEHAAALIIKLAAKRIAASADANVSHMTTAQQTYQAELAKTSL